ncbi:AcaB family transcriptional regulator [Noviherbaspirillum autotrophicum]|uniref:AcaB family transcriptional regulator n=1 Tax=Noviherbaspirillum autotrophicum TaxID=709839 RepID=UPI000B228A3E|nr:AcaB family transcriptional regulator [Noviherbaspirillum autotrophicum]
MANDAMIKWDQSGINARILAKEVKADFRRVEAASRKIPTAFYSPEAKRLFVRCFNSLQLNAHFISVIARTRLPHAAVETVEAQLQQHLDRLAAELDKAIQGAEALCIAHGITSLASYDTAPLAIEVKVISTFGRRYLELLTRVDQLMPMLETLAIDGVIGLRELDRRKAQFKRAVRQAAGMARNVKGGLQRRMNAQANQQAGKRAEPNAVQAPAESALEPEGQQENLAP